MNTKYIHRPIIYSFIFIFISLKAFGFNPPTENSYEKTHKGIANQLEFLIERNTTKVAPWYVYFVGENSIDESTINEYLEYQLELSQITTENNLVLVSQLNKVLSEVNAELIKKGKPVIYYGVGNKKTAIVTPYFPFEGMFNTTGENKEELLHYFNNNLLNTTKEIRDAKKVLNHFVSKELKSQTDALLESTLAKAEGAGAVALSKFYYAFVKKNANQSPKIVWYSQKDYKVSGGYFSNNPVDYELVSKHLNQLKNTNDSNNIKRIKAWANYLLGKELLDLELLNGDLVAVSDLDNSERCKNLTEGIGKKDLYQLEQVIKTDIAEDIVNAIAKNCSKVVDSLSYPEIIRAITTISKESINERAEVGVLRLMHAVDAKDYYKFFADIKKDELFDRLRTKMNDRVLSPFGGNNYTSLIHQLLFMANSTDYRMKKERMYLIQELFPKELEYPSDQLLSAMTFKIRSSEPDYEQFLSENKYERLTDLIVKYSINEGDLFHLSKLFHLGKAIGSHYQQKNETDIYMHYLNLVYESNESTRVNKDDMSVFVAGLFTALPENSKIIYDFIMDKSENRLQKILSNGAVVQLNKILPEWLAHVIIPDNKNNLTYSDAFINGITTLMDKNNDIQSRLDLYDWLYNKKFTEHVAKPELLVFESFHSYVLSKIFTNITSTNHKKQIHVFLKEDGFARFKAATTDLTGQLKWSKYLSEFMSNYMEIISEVGTMEDRINLLEHALTLVDLDLLFKEKEKIVGHIFDHVKEGTEFEAMYKALSENENELFTQAWAALETASIVFEPWHTDNPYATNFINNITKLMIQIKGKVELPGLYDDYTDAKVDYLNTNPEELPFIEVTKIRYLPLYIGSNASETDKSNYYNIESNINIKNKSKVELKVRFSTPMNRKSKLVINTTELNPFDYVYVEFLNDIWVDEFTGSGTLSKNKITKGTIKAVPAMYLAWLDNIRDGKENALVFSVMLDVAGLVAAIPSGGQSLTAKQLAFKFIDIAFQTGGIALTLNEDVLMRSEEGQSLINHFNSANLFFSVATGSASSNAKKVIMITPVGETLDNVRKLYSTTQKVNGLINDVSGFDVIGFFKDTEKVKASLSQLKSTSVEQYSKLKSQVADFKANLDVLLDTLPEANKTDIIRLSGQANQIYSLFHETP